MVIKTEKEFKIAQDLVDKVLYREREFPTQVFKENYSKFVFDEFDSIGCADFWDNALKNLCEQSGDSSVFVIMIDEGSIDFFVNKNNFYCAIKMPMAGTGQDYVAALWASPQKRPSAEMFYVSNRVAIIPESKKWAIYGERGPEICTLAFQDGFCATLKRVGNLHWLPAESAIKQLMGFGFKSLKVPDEWADEFLKNYSK